MEGYLRNYGCLGAFTYLSTTAQVQVPAPATHMIHCQEGGKWWNIGCGMVTVSTNEAVNIAVHVSVEHVPLAKIWLQRTFGSFCHKRYFSKAWSVMCQCPSA